MNKVETIAGVAEELHASEQALDAAIAHATTLVQAMINARADLNISAVVGAEAQTKALEAIAGLATARQAMVACHDHLAKDHRRLGFGTFAGPFYDKYPPTAGENRLRAV